MPSLSHTLANIARYTRNLEHSANPSRPTPGQQAGVAAEIMAFGANPGELRLFAHVPAALPAGAALVVVLHGCGQTAAGYAAGAGWIELADRFGFALLLPEQRRANNAGGCFNWFQPEDTARDRGEAASVRAMVQHLLSSHRLNPKRVFVTGLSAGGAFANVLLATYPEVCAGGAIVAGLPFGAATNTQSALEAMYRGRQRSDREWGDAVRTATDHRGPWPRIAVWHGMADTTVIAANGTDIVRQWLDVHGLTQAPPRREERNGVVHLQWAGPDGGVAVESTLLPHLAHGVPISAHDPDPDRSCGKAAPYILEAGLSSSFMIAHSWGLTRTRAATASPPIAEPPSSGVAAIIHKALAAAGLAS